MSGPLRERVLREVVLCDGAIGTTPRRAGLPAGHCAEEWNLTNPEAVAAAHRGYVEAGADVVGANCGGGPAEILAAVQEMHEVASAEPLVAQPNAGKPRLVSSGTALGVTQEVMSFYVPAFLEAGVWLLGACCGSTPAHLRAMASAVAQQTTEASE